ncbi:hypothetical protein B0H16DRAFT_1526917 [Mycena metata]|uniref:Uncharacterized protein n=1 Tax=Mycena metata TaxID=1033252 RepID=A0AAD7DNQ8_9AGAR|nr:hypothetical protein B0H16DRAFT_1648397 [Mycena metata]KAJ7764391.1 hypothetical protein B0H16DRAFT_1526917 [Mycena metata]
MFQSRAHAGRRSVDPSYTTLRPPTQTQTHTPSPAHAGRRSVPQNIPSRATTIGDTPPGSAAHPLTQIPSRDTKRARRRNIPRAIPESFSSTPTSPLPPIPTHTTPTPTSNAKTKSLYGTKRSPIHRALSRRVSSFQVIFSESTAFLLHPRRRAQPPSRGVCVTKDEQQPMEDPQDAASLQIRAMLVSVVAQKKKEEAEEARLWALLNSNGRPVIGGERKFGRVRMRMRSDKGMGRMCGFERRQCLKTEA